MLERFMRVVAGGATDPPVIGVTFAVEDAVGLEADVVDPQTSEQGKLIAHAMAGGAEILCQLVAAEAGRIEDQFGARLPRLARRDMFSARSMTGFTPDAER
jgi:hypothetical protein